jgi:hypothetical protein
VIAYAPYWPQLVPTHVYPALIEAFKLSESQADELLSEVDPYRMPGLSYAMAAMRALLRSGKRLDVGDTSDLGHALWATYCDLAFVDKRTEAFIAQERRSRSTSLCPFVRPRFRRATSSIAKTIDEIRLMVTARTTEHPFPIPPGSLRQRAGGGADPENR